VTDANITQAVEFKINDPAYAPWVIRIARDRGLSRDESREALELLREWLRANHNVRLNLSPVHLGWAINELDFICDRIIDNRGGPGVH
jgi:hypothetical protein